MTAPAPRSTLGGEIREDIASLTAVPHAAPPKLQCVVVTPERAFLDEKADFVVLPMVDGELGALPKHAPLVGQLGKGQMRITQGERVRKFRLDGGFAQIRNNVVTVLTLKVSEEADEVLPEAV